MVAHSFSDARKRQIAKLAGAEPPTARAAIALAKSQAYQDAADAPATPLPGRHVIDGPPRYDRYAETLAEFHVIAFVGYMLKHATALVQSA